MEPHFISKALSEPDTRSGRDYRRSEHSLRLGIVTDVYPPNHPKNVSKRYDEYMVDVFIMGNAGTVKSYPAVVSDLFSSVGDTFQFRPRVTKKSAQNYWLSAGSRVAVLCVNSDTQQALIIGGWPNPNLPVISSEPDPGQYLYFEYNGMVVAINKDGELVVQRKGATDEHGNVLDGYVKNNGARIVFDKAGNVLIASGANDSEGEDLHVLITLTPDGKINLVCRDGLGVTTDQGKGLVINEGSHPMVRGDKLMDAIKTLMNSVSAAVSSIPPNAPAGGATAATAIQQAVQTFSSQTSSILSSGNKVD